MNQTIPSAVLPVTRDFRDYVRGISSGITPAINLPTGDWSAYLPFKEPQKYKFDTNECTGVSFVNCVEIQLNWLMSQGKLNTEWFNENGYLDATGSFALSERFIGILSGTSIKGNTTWSQWKTASKVGFLPRQDLAYSLEQSDSFGTPEAMCADYYNPKAVTPVMRAKALQALQYIQIQYEWIGGEFDSVTPLAMMREAIKQAPLHVAVPVCSDANWNNFTVAPCSSPRTDHAITLYNILSDGSFDIFDHYNPYNKGLSAGYLIPQVILGVVIPAPLPPPELASDLALHPTQAPDQAELSYYSSFLRWITKWFLWSSK